MAPNDFRRVSSLPNHYPKITRSHEQLMLRRSIGAYSGGSNRAISPNISPNTNKRGDEYGGAFENRLRLLREVLEDTLEVAGGDRAVALRFSVAEPDKPTGLRHDGEGRAVVEALAELPDLWDVNIAGWPADSQTARFSEEGFQLPFTDFVKTVTSKPVVGVGRFVAHTSGPGK